MLISSYIVVSSGSSHVFVSYPSNDNYVHLHVRIDMGNFTTVVHSEFSLDGCANW